MMSRLALKLVFMARTDYMPLELNTRQDDIIALLSGLLRAVGIA